MTRLGGALAGLATVVVSLALAVAADARLGTPEQVSSDSGFLGRLAVDDYGHAWAAWTSMSDEQLANHDYGHARIVLADRFPGHPWNVRPLTDAGAAEPAVGVAASGRVGVTWLMNREITSPMSAVAELHATTADPGHDLPAGQLLSAAAVTSPPTKHSIAVSRQETMVVWQDASTSGIYVSTAGANGGFSPPKRLSDGTGRQPEVAMNPAGAAVVAWLVGAGPTAIQYTYRPPGGEFEPARTIASGGSYGPAPPKVAMDGDGDALVTWYADDVRNTYAMTRPAHGPSVAARVIGEGMPDPHAFGLRGFSVMQTQLGNGPHAFSKLVSSSDGGVTFGLPEELPGNNDTGHMIAVDLAGDAMMLWWQYQSGYPPQVLVGASRPAGGLWSDPIPLGEPASNPALASSASGRVVAGWSIYDSDRHTERPLLADGTLDGAPDTAAPEIEVGALRREGTVLRMSVKCNEPCSLRWRASARRGLRTLKSSGRPIKASTGERRTVTATLPRVPRSQKVRLQLVVTDLARNVVRRTYVR